MSDLISRQAAIYALERKKDKNANGDIGGFYNKIIQNDIDALMQLPPAQPEHGRWIPCEERMPKEPFGCLVTVMDTEPMTGEDFENLYPYFVGWDGEQWNDGDGDRCPFEVLAWIPLPEPYKMDGESDETD